MKKLFFAVAVVAAISFASCGNKTNANAEAADSLADTTLVDTTALAPETMSTFNALSSQVTSALNGGDAKSLTTALANLVATYKTFANSGKLEELKGYGRLVKNFVNQHADKIKSIAGDNAAVTGLLNGIQALPTDASATLEAAKNAVSADAVGLASSALQKGAAAGATAEAAAEALKNAPATATEAVNKAVTDAKASVEKKATETVSNAKEKANEAADKAVNNAKEKAGAAVDDAASKIKGKLGF